MAAPALFTYRATLDRVIDGDSCELLIDLGFRTFTRGTFRLMGINCPEMNTEAGKAAFSEHPEVKRHLDRALDERDRE